MLHNDGDVISICLEGGIWELLHKVAKERLNGHHEKEWAERAPLPHST